jgi:hypothetical protein
MAHISLPSPLNLTEPVTETERARFLKMRSKDVSFVYCLPGWEGSASDARVYEDARAKDFAIPEGKYYLADAGYGLSDTV